MYRSSWLTEARYIIYRRGMRKKEEKRDEVCKAIALSSFAPYIEEGGFCSGNHIIPKVMIVSFTHPFVHFFVP